MLTCRYVREDMHLLTSKVFLLTLTHLLPSISPHMHTPLAEHFFAHLLHSIFPWGALSFPFQKNDAKELIFENH